MKFAKLFYPFIFSIGITIPVIAQNKYSTINAKVDSFIHLKMRELNFAGLSLAVMHNGKIIHSKGFGYANLEHKIPAATNTVYLMLLLLKLNMLPVRYQ